MYVCIVIISNGWGSHTWCIVHSYSYSHMIIIFCTITRMLKNVVRFVLTSVANCQNVRWISIHERTVRVCARPWCVCVCSSQNRVRGVHKNTVERERGRETTACVNELFRGYLIKYLKCGTWMHFSWCDFWCDLVCQKVVISQLNRIQCHKFRWIDVVALAATVTCRKLQ